ncbi:fibronectin type III domain-containing protein [Persicobacter diffluens]|uniref:Uncharacterized protein n=1 Tax=Persicobacter diffluens TaxID=981 RepID=A0AAN4W287_9BACT|nr:hypothetical protein PEDI_48930 [Persicobacter diffluens]
MAKAQEIIQWEFQDMNGAASSTAISHAEGITVSEMTLGQGLEPINYRSHGFTAKFQEALTLQEALDKGEYFTFTVTPEEGKVFSLSNIDLRPVSQNMERNFALLSSVNGFDTEKVLATFAMQGNGDNPRQIMTVNDHQNLFEPVEFRIYIYGVNDKYTAVGFGLGEGMDFIANGEVAENNNYLNIDASSFSFPSEGATQSMEISSNVSWFITNTTPWLSISPMSGTGDATLSIVAAANPLIERSGSFTIKGNGETKLIQVQQAENLDFINNPATFTLPEVVRLNQHQSQQYFLISNLKEDPQGELSFEVTFDDADFAELQEVQYTANSRFAVAIVNLKKGEGSTMVNVTVDAGESTFSQSTHVEVTDYDAKGWAFSMYDIEFWKEEYPTELTASVYEEITPNSIMPYDELNWDDIPLTVGIIGGQKKDDFFTATLTGYITPPVSGNYKFHLYAHEPGRVFFSETTELQRDRFMLYDKHDIDSPVSDDIYLEKGKVYGIYCSHHQVVGPPRFQLMWSSTDANINEQLIPATYTYHSWDDELPSTPTDLKTDIIETHQAHVSWTAATDNKKVVGYNIYLNGMLMAHAKDTEYVITDLEAETHYALAVTALDALGNESLISNIETFTTYQQDLLPPTPPTALNLDQSSGVSVKVSWSGAQDQETTVVGYYLYVDGNLYSQDRVKASSAVLTNLKPEQSYDIEIVAVDASGNESVKSKVFSFSTTTFDPNFTEFGAKVAALHLLPEPIAYNTGIGINGPYYDGSLTRNEDIRRVCMEMEPKNIRWGAITANSISFAASTGVDKVATYGEVMELCVETDAAFSLVVGVSNSVDYMTDSEATFIKLMDYVAGDSSTPGGQLRAAEGYEDPFLPQLPAFVIELGNEVWGGDAHRAEIGKNYAEYAKWCREMAAIIKAHPAYDPEKIKIVYSGRYPDKESSGDKNKQVLSGDNGALDVLGVSGYLGGDFRYDNTIGPEGSELNYYKNRYAFFAKRFHGIIETLYVDMFRFGKHVMPMYAYETNATTSSYNGKLGQALLISDYAFSMNRLGGIYPTLFHLTNGEWRITNAEAGYSPRPLYSVAQLLNQHTVGDVLNATVETGASLKNAAGEAYEFDPIGQHFYKNVNGKYVIALFSRDFESDYTVQLNIPSEILSGEVNADFYELSGNSFSSSETTLNVSNAKIKDGQLIQLKKHSLLIIEFEGEDFAYDPYAIGDFKYLRSNASIELEPYTDPNITENKGEVYVRIKGNPEDFFNDDNVEWEAQMEDGMAVENQKIGMVLHVKSEGQCESNGEVTLSASIFPDGEEKKSTLVVAISNQGNCDALSSEEGQQKIHIAPNPVTDYLSIKMEDQQAYTLKIFNNQGLLLKDQEKQDDARVYVGDLSQGVYFLQVTSGQAIHTVKFIKK